MGLRLRTVTLGVFGGIALSAAVAVPATASAQGPAVEQVSGSQVHTSAISAVRLPTGHSGNLVEVSGQDTKGQQMSRECAEMMARHPQQSHTCKCCTKTPADQTHTCECCKEMGTKLP